MLLLPGVLYYNNLYVVTTCICTADISSECWRTVEYRILMESTGKQKKCLFFYVHVTVHRNKFLHNKSNQMHHFPKFTPAWNSTCFGQFLCPSSGSLYTQHWYISYRFEYSFRAGPCSARKLSSNLYDIYQCRVYSDPDDGQRNCPKNVEFHAGVNLETGASGWFYYKEKESFVFTEIFTSPVKIL